MPQRRRLVWRLIAAIPTLLVLCLGAWVAIFALYAPALPDPGALMDQAVTPRIKVLAADDSVLADESESGSPYVPYDAISPWLVKAVVATEDRRFWGHFGLDPVGIARALVANLRQGGVVEGGSTITQQLAKILFLTPERSLRRKLEELTLAIWLEARLSKRDIITLYLNKVYLGAGAYGVEAAARRYFAKPAKNLTVAEAAMIAGLLKAPSALAPTNDLDAARDRAAVVIDRMLDAGYLDQAAADAARARPAILAPEIEGDLAGHFVDWVIEGANVALGRAAQGVTIRTTLDPRLQRAARDRLRAAIAREGARAGFDEGAVLLLDGRGAVRAMVGGPSYRASRFNRAVAAHRQPGSAFKPFVYVAALEHGFGATTLVQDAPIRIGDWSPDNYDGKYQGAVTLEEAFARSLNTPAVRIAQTVGVGAVVDVAHRLGIASPLFSVPSVALGTSEVTLLELTASYLPMATAGIAWPVYAVRSVTDGSGRALYLHKTSGTRVLDRTTAAAMQVLMREVVLTGTGQAAQLPDRVVAGKTGTTQNSRDAWFLGWSGDYVLGVWLGNDDGQPMRGVTGGGLPARLWRDIMATTPAPAGERSPPGAAGANEAALQPSTPSPGPRVATRGIDWLVRLVEDAWATARR